MNIFILIIGVSAVIPEFKTGTYNQLDYAIEINHILYSSNVPGRSDTRTVPFGYTFRDIPQVAIAIHNYDYLADLPFGCSIEVISTTKTDFTFKATEYTGKTWFRLPIDWYAFNDESIEIINFKLEQPTMVVGLNTISKTRKLANTGILILSGFQYSKDPNFYAEIVDVTETDFVVQLIDPNACLKWVTYQVVLGNQLNVWFQGLQKIVPKYTFDYFNFDHTLVFPDIWLPLKKFAIMGLNGFSASASQNQRLFFSFQLNTNSLDYRIGYWGTTIEYEVRYQILVYRLLEFEQSCVTIALDQLPHVLIDIN